MVRFCTAGRVLPLPYSSSIPGCQTSKITSTVTCCHHSSFGLPYFHLVEVFYMYATYTLEKAIYFTWSYELLPATTSFNSFILYANQLVIQPVSHPANLPFLPVPCLSLVWFFPSPSPRPSLFFPCYLVDTHIETQFCNCFLQFKIAFNWLLGLVIEPLP